MNGILRKWLDKIYFISERKFVLLDIALAGFIVLAHGGALAVTYSRPPLEAAEIRQLASISLPLAAMVILSSAASLVYVRLRPKVLALHGIVLAVGASILLLWALSVLLNGLPEGRFAWSVGFLTATVFYAAILFCRFTVLSRLRSSWGAYYAPLFALACAVPVDIGVFLRAAG